MRHTRMRAKGSQVKKIVVGMTLGSALTALLAAGLTPAAAQETRDTAPTGAGAAHRSDNRPGPLTKQRTELREQAIDQIAKGKARANADGVVEVADGKFVETETTTEQRQEKIFTILSEFGTEGSGKLGTVPGPLHNEIAQPDRSVDNSNAWTADFDKAYYENLFNGSGESMKTYYEKLSGGRYSVTNVVEDWVKVPHNASF